MRTAMTLCVAFATVLLTSGELVAQHWCTYDVEQATVFDCGYSTEKACKAAAKEVPRSCTRDPFFR